MDRTKLLVFAGVVCAMFVWPLSTASFAQCSVISVDAGCADSVAPHIRVDFGVPPPAIFGGRTTSRPVAATHDQSSTDVPLLLRVSPRECTPPAASPRTRGGHRGHTVIAPAEAGRTPPAPHLHGLCGTHRR